MPGRIADCCQEIQRRQECAGEPLVDNSNIMDVDNRLTIYDTPGKASMGYAERILRIVRESGNASGAKIASILGISRQAVHRHLGRMLDEGKLERDGRTRGVLYRLPGTQSKSARASTGSYGRTFTIEGLQEDIVFTEVSSRLDLKRTLSTAAYRIFNYAFTEMLNNAVEHSRSPTCRIGAALKSRDLVAVIRDQGIGVYNSIARRMALRDENDAVGELLKGKATTAPDRHSGEGIFFTSKACDLFALRSHRLELITNARTHDVVLNIRKPIRGTEVTLHISRSARRELADVMAAFAPEQYDFRFEKSVVVVRFSAREYVSRSEARRLLVRLEKFSEVAFDFAGVRSIGQGFADEIFRVFAESHPKIVISRRNVDPALEIVIHHVVDNAK
jgi:biotin operon repressor/anti-sigma regulatory factor (Ser/Thr protein kinase)